jgi:hypothetical protein
MVAAEFQGKIIDGRIEIPEALRERFLGDVKVILFAEGAEADESGWPAENRRRWDLIAREARQGLTEAETRELAVLQQRADEQLAQVGQRPLEELERWYAELNREGSDAPSKRELAVLVDQAMQEHDEHDPSLPLYQND